MISRKLYLIISIKLFVVFLDPCFAAVCKDCAAKPDDSTTCGRLSTNV